MSGAGDELIVPAPAKLNLFLHVTGRRADGYHELQTLFRLLDHGDTLHFRATTDGRVSMDSNRPDMTAPDNLVLRAAHALRELPATPASRGARIHLEKRLPSGGGLGGGSSDAATTLLALNRLWNLALDEDVLAGIGLRLGADVPVFLRGRSAWATGIGEQLRSVNLPAAWYVVLTPACEVSTAAIFSHRELTRNGSAIKIAAFLEGRSRNDCEPLVRTLYPEVDNALKELGRFAEARLTGTGASVFAAFPDRQEAEEALAAVQHRNRALPGFVAAGVNRSPALEALEAAEGLQKPGH